MKRLTTFFFALAVLSLFFTCCRPNNKSKETFELGNQTFLLNGKPFVIRAAELHYPRIPKEYWEHRIEMCKAMGMNTVCLYVFWNLHEQKEGVYDFSGQNDIKQFCKLAQKHGMYVIVRPGPYVCAEWDMGGLPWWLLKKKDIKVRCKEDAYFMERMQAFLKEVGKELAPMQLNNGGNIIMVQVENEYPSFGNDKQYMELVKQSVINAGFDNVQLFTCAWSSNFRSTMLDSVLCTLNFGAGSNINEQFKLLKEVQPTTPLMCSEYWSGWFDHWGRPHETRSIENLCGSMKDMLDQHISFSLYMAHGGTTFGQWGGANTPPYSTMCTSYDYDAPINEAGQTTEKFFAVRELLSNYLNEGEVIPDVPVANPVIEIPEFDLPETADLFANLPEAHQSEQIQSMEMFDQGWGRILYRTRLTSLTGNTDEALLKIDEVHDWATIYLNGKAVGTIDRRKGEKTVKLPALKQNDQLDILVEATGRVNFGEGIIDRKGITEKVTLAVGENETELTGWEVYNFPVDYAFQAEKQYQKAAATGAAWHKGTFKLEKTGDTFIDMSTWGKGMVWVNGYNIGRFWKIGPQQTLYVPGCWLKKGDNEIIVLDLEQPKKATIKGLGKPVLDRLQVDESLLHRKQGEELDLSKEKPVKSGTFAKGNEWQKVTFAPTTGRYFCFEALSSFKDDGFASIAELYLLDEKGKDISRKDWSIVYADSEEISAANAGADKVYDLQESTFWHTNWSDKKPGFPHQIIIDLGATYKITGFRYLPRPQENYPGIIKDYRVYLKETPFTITK